MPSFLPPTAASSEVVRTLNEKNEAEKALETAIADLDIADEEVRSAKSSVEEHKEKFRQAQDRRVELEEHVAAAQHLAAYFASAVERKSLAISSHALQIHSLEDAARVKQRGVKSAEQARAGALEERDRLKAKLKAAEVEHDKAFERAKARGILPEAPSPSEQRRSKSRERHKSGEEGSKQRRSRSRSIDARRHYERRRSRSRENQGSRRSSLPRRRSSPVRRRLSPPPPRHKSPPNRRRPISRSRRGRSISPDRKRRRNESSPQREPAPPLDPDRSRKAAKQSTHERSKPAKQSDKATLDAKNRDGVLNLKDSKSKNESKRPASSRNHGHSNDAMEKHSRRQQDIGERSGADKKIRSDEIQKEIELTENFTLGQLSHNEHPSGNQDKSIGANEINGGSKVKSYGMALYQEEEEIAAIGRSMAEKEPSNSRSTPGAGQRPNEDGRKEKKEGKKHKKEKKEKKDKKSKIVKEKTSGQSEQDLASLRKKAMETISSEAVTTRD